MRERRDQKNRTLLKTIRITKELDDILHKDAKDKRVSVNALISIVMKKYAEMIDTGMRETLGLRPNFDTTKNSVIVKFNS